MRPLGLRQPHTVLVLLALAIPAAGGTSAAEVGLTDAVRQALESNLDLAARQHALAADREEIELARARLLPQITLGAQAQALEDDRTDDSRGSITERSVTVDAGLTQVLYDEMSWANFTSQKHVYAARAQQLAGFRLDVIGDTANAFLELGRTQAVLAVQKRNREITVRNTETTRARIAAGWSSENEVLRWQSTLAANDRDIAQASAAVLVSRFALNSLRNVPREAPIASRNATIDEHGFVYASDVILGAIADPDGDRRMRDLLVREGRARSPELMALDEAIAAQERQLTANKRVFWIPSLGLKLGVNHLADDGGSSRDFEETEWGVGARLSFPLLQGGAKFADLRQARETIATLRMERRAAIVALDDGIRSAFAQASGSYASLRAVQRQQTTADRYFELTNASYRLGVASLLNLLDAQHQQLEADIAATNARYDLLEDIIAAEKELAFFPFIEPEAEVRTWMSNLEREVQIEP